VHIKRYSDAHARVETQHRSIDAAMTSLRSVTGGRKHRIRNLQSAYIWCARNNTCYYLARGIA